MTEANLVLEYLKVLLSAPPMAALVVLAFIGFFRSNIADLIGRVFSLKFPGGELQASQREKSAKELHEARGVVISAGTESVSTGEIRPDEAREIIQSERVNAAIWEYRYLNYYLVRSTQLVLDWLGTFQHPVSLRLLDSYLQQWTPSVKEREAIIGALQNHHLITVNNDLVQITPKGREYLQWRGPLPPAGGALGLLS